MWNKIKAGTFIRSILTANTGIVSMVGDNILPLVAPKETQGDIIIYWRDKYSRTYTNMGISTQECIINVVVISDDYDRSQELAELIDGVLVGTHDGSRVNLSDSTEGFEDGKYLQVLVFSIE